MQETPRITEGKLPFHYGDETYETYYKVAGELSSTSVPLVFVHGAPGTSHDYGVPLYDLSVGSDARAVIFYDQIGSSRSTHLPDKPSSFWTFELFIAELQNVVHRLGVENAYHLLGHSWGGLITVETVLRHHPKGLKKIVLSNTLARSKLYAASVKDQQRAMGDDIWRAIQHHEKEKTTDDPEYDKAIKAFNEKHICRAKPFPEELAYTLSLLKGDDGKESDGAKVWAAVENFFDEWWIDDQIHRLDVPALLINGEFDYMTDAVCGPYFWRMNKVKWIKFAESSHTPMWEERERYMDAVRSFLRNSE